MAAEEKAEGDDRDIKKPDCDPRSHVKCDFLESDGICAVSGGRHCATVREQFGQLGYTNCPDAEVSK